MARSQETGAELRGQMANYIQFLLSVRDYMRSESLGPFLIGVDPDLSVTTAVMRDLLISPVFELKAEAAQCVVGLGQDLMISEMTEDNHPVVSKKLQEIMLPRSLTSLPPLTLYPPTIGLRMSAKTNSSCLHSQPAADVRT